MKLPASDSIKSVLMLVSLGLGAYTIWKIAQVPQALKDLAVKSWGEVTGGFVQTAPNAGRIVSYSNTRDTSKLDVYFDRYGPTQAAINEAQKAGWTWDEVSLAAAAWNDRKTRAAGLDSSGNIQQ